MLQAVRLLTELARPTENSNHHHNHHHHHHHRRESEVVTMESGQQTASSSLGSVATEGSVQFREIYKNGWLRRTDKTDKETNRFWVAFCVHDDTEPRLEGFTDQKQATTHLPLWAQSLRGIQHLSPTLCATQRHDYEFCVNFSDDRVLRLASPTYQGMLDWVQLITRKLTDMKILRPKENLYSKGPERIATRDPTSPLPPPPLSTGSSTSQQSTTVVASASNLPPVSSSVASTSTSGNNIGNGSSLSSTIPTLMPATGTTTASITTTTATTTTTAATMTTTTTTPSSSSTSSPGREPGTSLESAPMVFTFDDISLEERRVVRPIQGGLQRAAPPTPSPRIVATATTSEENSAGDSGYESIFMASSYSPTGDSARGARDVGQTTATDPSNERYAVLQEYRSSTTSTESNQAPSTRTESRQANRTETRTVGPITSNVHRQLTLREQQVFQLRREMAHPAGVRLLLGRRDCKDSIAFVDTYGAVWVAGWKQREHPLLYNVLHVGDLVLSVAGITPLGAAAIRDILKGCTTPRVEVIVRRLPYARAVTLTKRNDSDDFGLEVNGNEISGVSGVALSLGLPPLATATDPTAPSGSNTTWTLTEINGKPLNIFDGGACERFRAVGRDISIVIQPTDLVSSLRKKLRSIRSYKNFVMQ